MSFELPDSFYTSDALASVALLCTLLVTHLVARHALRRRENLTEQVARRWTANLRNVLVLIGVVGLIMIWAPQLRTFALSLTAVAVALVVATKELILCLSGAALRTFTQAFSVGDIVEIGSTKGEVLDLNLLAVRLSEFDAREGAMTPTGRTVIMPYSLLFISPARVLPHSSRNAAHRFVMTFEPAVNIFQMRREIERVANETLEQVFPATTPRDGDALARKKASAPSPEIRLDFATSDIGKYRIEANVTGEPGRTRDIENALTCSIGSYIHSQRNDRSPTEEQETVGTT